MRAIICAQVGSADPGYCLRRVDDAANRADLSDAQQSRARLLAQPLIAAIDERGLVERCVVAVKSPFPAGDPPPCAVRRTPLSVEDLRALLERTGHPAAVVRMARYDDPAPANSVVYAVRLADACLVGFINTETRQWDIVGQLVAGVCLTP